MSTSTLNVIIVVLLMFATFRTVLQQCVYKP